MSPFAWQSNWTILFYFTQNSYLWDSIWYWCTEKLAFGLKFFTLRHFLNKHLPFDVPAIWSLVQNPSLCILASPLPPQSSPTGLSSQKTHQIKQFSPFKLWTFSVDTTRHFWKDKPMWNLNSPTLINGFRAKLIETLKNLYVVLLRVCGHCF